MELSFIFVVFGLAVNAKSEELQDFPSLQNESIIYPAALRSKYHYSNNSREASTKSLPYLTVALIGSPGTNLFHAPHERHHSATLNTTTSTAEEVINLREERFVLNRRSESFTSSEASTLATHLTSEADLMLISDKKEQERVVTSAVAGSGLMVNCSMMATAHLSRGKEKIAVSLHAPLNSKNQRAMESITLLPAKSIPMLSASHPAVTDDLGEATEIVERQRKSINENRTLNRTLLLYMNKTSLGASNPLNNTESVFVDGEKIFVQKGSPTIMHLTAVPNRTQLVTEGGTAEVQKVVDQEPGEEFKTGQSGQKNMPALSLVTPRNGIFDVDTLLPLLSSSQEVVKITTYGTKSLTTKGHARIVRVHTNAIHKELYNSKFFQPSEVPFPKTGKLHITRSFIKPSLTPKLQKILSAGDESGGELTVTSTGDRQVGTTVHSPSQSVQPSQRTALVKDEARFKFLVVLPFTDGPLVLIKVKNATQAENGFIIAPQNISSNDSNFVRMYDHCCKVSIENGTFDPQGKENPDKLSLIDNRTEHFHKLIIKSLSSASSSMPFAVALRNVTVSAQKTSHSESTVNSGKTLTKLTPSSPITQSNSIRHPDQLQNIPTTPIQTPSRETQYLSPIFKGHAVTYSPVKQLLISSMMGSAKPLTYLSSLAGHSRVQSARVLKEHPKISPLGYSASTLKSVTFQESKKVQGSTSFHPVDENREPTVFLKLPTLHSKRLIRTTNTWPLTEKSSINSSFLQFTRTPGSDERDTLFLSVSAVTPAPQTFTTNVPTTTALAEHFATASFLDTKQELFFSTLSNKRVPQDIMPVSSSRPGRPPVISKLLEITERGVINRDIFTNQTLTTEQAKEKNVNYSAHVPASIGNVTLEHKTQEMDLRMFSMQPELKQLTVLKLESSTGEVVLDQNDQNTFSMQNNYQAPATVLWQNIVPFLQSRGQYLQKTTKGRINASLSPAVTENFQSAQPLASAAAETPKTVDQTINQASLLISTSSSIITDSSDEKDITGSLLPDQATQHTISARKSSKQAASSQAPSTTEALKKHTINIMAVKPVILSPSTSAAPRQFTSSLKSPHPGGSLSMQSTSRSLPSIQSGILTDFLTTLRAHRRVLEPQILPLLDVGENVVKKHSTQTLLPPITEGTFYAVDHTHVTMKGSEITAKESPQTGSLQVSEESEGHLSTVFPFKSNLAKSAEQMSDLPLMQRKMRIASPDFLSGLAQISDDICGSGNYTAEMRLTLERDIMPGDLIPALGNLHVVINLKTNNTQVNLEIKSCCLSPTVTVDEFNTTCCQFSRLPIDPQGIRLLPNVLSKRASFTISLFQMINYSTAYLHCDLSVCLRNNSECERYHHMVPNLLKPASQAAFMEICTGCPHCFYHLVHEQKYWFSQTSLVLDETALLNVCGCEIKLLTCQQRRNAHSSDDGEIIISNTGNRISFGPVLKETDESPFIETTGVDSSEAAIILGSVSGCFLVCIALLLFCTIYRRRLQRSGHCHCWTLHGCSGNREHFLP